MSRPAGVYCRVLGPVQVTVAGADAPPELLWRKHVALLVYLARSPRRRRTREHLVGLLWSDRDEKQARHSLSEALRVFRRALGDDQVQADVDQIGLGADGVTLDCDRFAELYARGDWAGAAALVERSEEHTSELQSRLHLVCRLLLEKKKTSVIYISC